MMETYDHVLHFITGSAYLLYPLLHCGSFSICRPFVLEQWTNLGLSNRIQQVALLVTVLLHVGLFQRLTACM